MRKTAGAVAIALAVVFIAGLYWLFHLRFEEGDVYPMYSTYRADPLGAKALYESLALQPGVRASRNLRPLGNVHGRDATVFLLGLRAGSPIPPEVEGIAHEGGRVVVAFVPERPELQKKESHPATQKASPLGAKVQRETTATPEPAPDAPPRYTAVWFDKLAPEWIVVRRYEGRPVLIERPLYKGSVVLIADSWMLSNEALATEPDAPMLARIAGPNHNFVFDESHLGIERSGSVAGMVRKYRLQGVVGVLLVLALLFIWKSASTFLPRESRSTDAAVLAGHSTRAGLVNLLERSVPPAKLMEVCVKEYEDGRRKAPPQPERLPHIPDPTDPVASYELVRKTLEEIRHPWKQTSSS